MNNKKLEELSNQIADELKKYNELREELKTIDHLRNKKEVDHVVELLMESNKIITRFRNEFNELSCECSDI